LEVITSKVLQSPPWLGWPLICSTCCKHFWILSSFMTCHQVCYWSSTKGATSGAGTAHPSGIPEFTPVFSGVRITRYLVLSECFADRCLSFCPFSFDHCVVCSSSIYVFWLLLWYLQTLLLAKYYYIYLKIVLVSEVWFSTYHSCFIFSC
jgi:hypothetical protein